MRPAPFDYAEPATVGEACALLAERAGEVAVLAGGQSLVAQLNAREVRPALVMGIRRLTELDGAAETGDTLRIGARITQRAWQQHPLAKTAPLLQAALDHVGHVPTRNRGTVGGSIAFADPTAELPTALLALDGAVRLRSSAGERTVRAADFFLGPFRSARRPDELLTAVEIPLAAAGRHWVFEQRHYRRHGKVSVAVVAAPDGGPVTVAVGGVGATPLCLPLAPDLGLPEAVAAATDLLVPGTDHLASDAHRRALLAAALTAALTELRRAATGRAA
jgi:CO/xanthine dehydrogenase FAD-binding subunit